MQELLASSTVRFFARDWSYLGDRDSLGAEIELATGIEPGEDAEKASVARKMSWLSHRQTTREEDMVYCMLGLFGVNMPLLYGEGPKAFHCLQEEIVRQTADLTIFCWWHSTEETGDFHPLLAPRPSTFRAAGGFFLRPKSRNIMVHTWSITTRGLSLSLPTIRTLSGAFIRLDDVQHKDTLPHESWVFLHVSS